MVIDIPQQLNRLVEEIGADYEKKGYQVFYSPSGDDLPSFLHGFRPNLIAKNSNDSIVLEVKSATAAKDNDYLLAVREAVRQNPGWNLRIAISRESSDPHNSVSLEEINNLLAQSEELEKENRLTASLLVAWPAIEASMRRTVEQHKIEVPDFGTRTLVARLYSDGDLEREEYDLLERYVKANYMAGHGYRENIKSGELEHLRQIARRLLTE